MFMCTFGIESMKILLKGDRRKIMSLLNNINKSFRVSPHDLVLYYDQVVLLLDNWELVNFIINK